MPGGAAGGQRLVPVGYGMEDQLVILDRPAQIVHGGAELEGAHLLLKRAHVRDGVDEEDVVGSGGQMGMELLVGAAESREVVLGDGLSPRVHRPGESADLLGGRPLGRQAGGLRLLHGPEIEEHDNVADVSGPEGRGPQAHQQAPVVTDENPPAALGPHTADRRQHLDRLAHGALADAQFLRELKLGRQAVARAQPPVRDQPDQLLDGQFVRRAVAGLVHGPPPSGVKHRPGSAIRATETAK